MGKSSRCLYNATINSFIKTERDYNPNWEDSTRLPEYYDGTYEYFKSLGIKEI